MSGRPGAGVDTLIRNVRVVDATGSRNTSILMQEGRIAALGDEAIAAAAQRPKAGGAVKQRLRPIMVIDLEGSDSLALMPAFVEPHAHLRDPGLTHKETLESGLLAAAAGGYGSLVCMGNTKPVLDDIGLVRSLHERAGALGLCELFPVLTLTRGMEGRDTGHLQALSAEEAHAAGVRLLSEDGKDLEDEGVFAAAFEEAARLGIPVSCHCDAGGEAARREKEAGASRDQWSRTEENTGTERALRLGRAAGARVHIAHVSTKEALEMVRAAKADCRTAAADPTGDGPAGPVTAEARLITAESRLITAEATPMHLLLTRERAEALGAESHGRVNPPLREEEDRRALIAGLVDGTIDMICTDHAPHSPQDKEGGAPGFVGLETAFAALKTGLVDSGTISLEKLSSLMSLAPARLLGLEDRGLVKEGLRADLVLVDLEADWTVEPAAFMSRGRNTPFSQMPMTAKVMATWQRGALVWMARNPNETEPYHPVEHP